MKSRIQIIALFFLLANSAYGLTSDEVSAESEAITTEATRQAWQGYQGRWTGSATMEENSCYYESGPVKRVKASFKITTVGRFRGLNSKLKTGLAAFPRGGMDTDRNNAYFVSYKRGSHGGLKNCKYYDSIDMKHVDNQSATFEADRWVYCGGLQICSTTYKGFVSKPKPTSADGFYKGLVEIGGSCPTGLSTYVFGGFESKRISQINFKENGSSGELNYMADTWVSGSIDSDGAYVFSGPFGSFTNTNGAPCEQDNSILKVTLKTPGIIAYSISTAIRCPSVTPCNFTYTGDLVRR